MTLSKEKVLHLLPRILSILIIVFISLFALDAFSESQWFLALIMHLIPSYILIIMAVIAWKNERLGGMIYIACALLILFFSHFEAIIISAPTFVIGVLFLSNKYLSKTKKKKSK